MITWLMLSCAVLLRGVAQDASTIDLCTDEGVKLVAGQWQYCDARLVEVDSRSADGKPARGYDIEPRAGAATFDDAPWRAIAATSLGDRRGPGKISFAWYRLNVTVPEKIGEFDPAGATATFEIVADDYAEVWVDGKLPREIGQSGGSVVAGFNAPNRVVLTRSAQPGQRFQIAVFAINGPISAAPDNFIFVRSAKLVFD